MQHADSVIELTPIGRVRRAPDGTVNVIVDAVHLEGLDGLHEGSRVDVLYWMHQLPCEQRRAMRVHPQGDPGRPRRGVFALRSPMRPNPIGVTAVTIRKIADTTLTVSGLDALDGSPVLDIKSARG